MSQMKELQQEAYQTAVRTGWFDKPVSFGESISLCHEELSEALKEYRNGHDLTEVYYGKDEQGNDKPEGVPIECADLILRTMTMCSYYGIDLLAAILEKMEYNKIRPYRHGGKVL